jgi:hypothetical protein
MKEMLSPTPAAAHARHASISCRFREERTSQMSGHSRTKWALTSLTSFSPAQIE